MLKRALCFFLLQSCGLTISFHFLTVGSKSLLIPGPWSMTYVFGVCLYDICLYDICLYDISIYDACLYDISIYDACLYDICL